MNERMIPVDVAVGRAIGATVAEHMMGTETSGGVYEMGHGMFGAYHWCACGWRSDDGPWRDPAAYVRGMGQAKIDHLANALNAAVREHVSRAQAEVGARVLREAAAEVQWVFDMQCPPVASHFAADEFGRGAFCAHRWWDAVLGGTLRDLRHRADALAAEAGGE